MSRSRLFVLLALLAASISAPAATDPAPISAVAPLVYQLDQSPGAHGYHYTFFGNAFFINEQGYLLTAAHVLKTFRNGGQPYILVSRPNSPPRLLQVTVVATDTAHDVAILLASPNPFALSYQVSYLPLAEVPAKRGQSVEALSLHPAKYENARSFDYPVADRSPGEILSLESTQLEKSAPAADVFLLSHSVELGQSGSPVVSANSPASSLAAVGLIEGQWLRSTAHAHTTSAGERVATPGAAIPIQPAIALLDRQQIIWHSAK